MHFFLRNPGRTDVQTEGRIKPLTELHFATKNVADRNPLITNQSTSSPGMSPLFLSQKMAAKEPEKKIPSTAAKATTRSA